METIKAQRALRLKKEQRRMDNRRQDLLTKLEETLATVAPERLEAEGQALCFQILYGLPPELQIRAAGCMLQRYLPIFERKQPSLTWPRQVLEDRDGWNGRWSHESPDYPEGADTADWHYWSAFNPFFHARHFKDDPVRLAANVCCTMADVAQARARHVWLADDPEAARIQREEDAFWAIDQELPADAPPANPPAYFKELESPAHGRYYNAAFIAVYRREWLHVAEWLRVEAVWQYPEPEDLDAMMQALADWRARDFRPMGATWEELGYPADYWPE
jgi:hypothetical protein